MTPPIWLGGLALVAGLALVVWGAERFTDGAIRLAARLSGPSDNRRSLTKNSRVRSKGSARHLRAERPLLPPG